MSVNPIILTQSQASLTIDDEEIKKQQEKQKEEVAVFSENATAPKTKVKHNIIEASDDQAFEYLNKAEADEEELKEYRTSQVQDTMYEKGNKEIKKGSQIAIGGVAVGIIAKLAIAAVASSGLGLLVGGAIFAGGLIWGGCKIAKGNEIQEQADMLNVAAGRDNIPHTDNNICSRIVSGICGRIFGSNKLVQDNELIEECANETKFDNNSTSERTIYTYQREPIEGAGEMQLAVVDCTIDSTKYNGQDDGEGGQIGYTQNDYALNAYYSTLMYEYTKTFNDELNDEQAERYIKLAKALETTEAVNSTDDGASEMEDNDFFDFNGDGYVNKIDLVAMRHYLDNNGDMTEFSAINTTDSINSQVIKDKFGENAMSYIGGVSLNIDTTKLDINNDGTVDEKDYKLIDKYLEARTNICSEYVKMGGYTKSTLGGDDAYNDLVVQYGIED